MKKLILFTILVLSTLNSFSQCEEVNEPKVLLIGDSWAFFMNFDGTFNSVLDQWGHSNYEYITEPDLAVNGARTEDFLTIARKNLMESYLNDYPSIKAVHISLGGNDFLGDWTVSYTPSETEALKLETKNELIELFDFLKSVRPDIQLVFSGYMYPNFEEIIAEAPVPEDHPFYGNWADMEFPTFEQLNSVLNDFALDVIVMADADPQLSYVHAPALMQYYFGQDTPLSVAPGGSYAAFTQPLPDGDVTYPSPQASMRDYGLFLDCFHLNPEGYEQMVAYQTQKVYHKMLMDDLYLLSDVVAETGSVTSSGSISGTVAIGEMSGDIHAAVLSFNTTIADDTTIAGASIFLHRDSLDGGNPIGGTLSLSLKSGYLGTSADLGAEDIMAPVDIIGDACVFGSSSNNGDWIRIDLPVEFLPFIVNDDITQFVITAPGASDELVYYSNGDDPEFAPVLNLKYKYQFADIDNKENVSISIFPNPANDRLILDSKGTIEMVEILDLNGKQMNFEFLSANELNIALLPKGTYIVKVKTLEGVFVQKFVKS